MTINGFVTQVSPAKGFEFNGTPVAMGAKTEIEVRHKDAKLTTELVRTLPMLYIGEPMEMTGDIDRKGTEYKAKKIVVTEEKAAAVSGLGIVDLIPAGGDPAAGSLLRADGYVMLIPAKAHTTFASPLASVADLKTNLWVRYSGKQRADGVLVVDEADFSINTVNHEEDRRRSKNEYDPAAVDPANAQSGASKHLVGVEVKRIPPWQDAAMQLRVDRVGESLVPAFQKALPESDPTRIHFRFQVTDEAHHRNAWALDSGIILIPHQVVERLPEDSQLAAVLADSIAETLEKQSFRDAPAHRKLLAANIVGAAAGVVIPGAGLATGLTVRSKEEDMLERERQQSARVSLCLMHDAGYDVAEAPMAWWQLAAKKADGPLPINMPDHTVFLYQYLGSTWRTQSAKQP